jgi:hypothetical protein
MYFNVYILAQVLSWQCRSGILNLNGSRASDDTFTQTSKHKGQFKPAYYPYKAECKNRVGNRRLVLQYPVLQNEMVEYRSDLAIHLEGQFRLIA